MEDQPWSEPGGESRPGGERGQVEVERADGVVQRVQPGGDGGILGERAAIAWQQRHQQQPYGERRRESDEGPQGIGAKPARRAAGFAQRARRVPAAKREAASVSGAEQAPWAD